MKTVSHKTRQERAQFLRRFFRDLNLKAGFKMARDPRNPGQKHIHAMVQVWHDERLAPATIQPYLFPAGAGDVDGQARLRARARSKSVSHSISQSVSLDERAAQAHIAPSFSTHHRRPPCRPSISPSCRPARAEIVIRWQQLAAGVKRLLQ